MSQTLTVTVTETTFSNVKSGQKFYSSLAFFPDAEYVKTAPTWATAPEPSQVDEFGKLVMRSVYFDPTETVWID